MKIKFAVLDRDSDFLDRLTGVLVGRYPEKVEVSVFTDMEIARAFVKETKLDLFIADASFAFEPQSLPSGCAFAWFVDNQSLDTWKDRKAIFKYQKVETIYKELLDLYADNFPDSARFRQDGDGNARLVTFLSPGGGSGNSTIAAACARRFAAAGNRTLYLNLEQFPSSDVFFSGAGASTFSDVVFALKSKRSNLSLKIESSIRMDGTGVGFFANAATPLDVRELTGEDISRLLNTLMLSDSFDRIVIDMDCSFSDKAIEILKQSARIVLVADGSEVSGLKLRQAVGALAVLEKQRDISLLGRAAVIFNKFSSKTGKMPEGIGLKTLGGAPRYEQAGASAIAAQIQQTTIFQEL